jgi:glycosyltransferase involved in cell wall biosynthesis
VQAESLRVAWIAGTLGPGGAEKQLVYAVAALLQARVTVRVYALTRGEEHELSLRSLGAAPVYCGRFGLPPARLATLALALRGFRPHVVHSVHFYTNLYAAAAARACGALSVGAIRSDLTRELRLHPFWGRRLLRWPDAIVTNSTVAAENARRAGRPADSVFVLPNTLDLADFDRRAALPVGGTPEWPRPCVAAIGRLIAVKRIDRFLRALALARRRRPDLTGLVVGDGPERASLEALAAELELLPEGVRFLGRRDDVPGILARVDALVLTSDQEGSPNVVLEAMAAGRPVIATPAGEVRHLVRQNRTGFVVAFDDAEELAARIVEVTGTGDLASVLGREGRRLVEAEHGVEDLPRKLLRVYADAAAAAGHRPVREILAA